MAIRTAEKLKNKTQNAKLKAKQGCVIVFSGSEAPFIKECLPPTQTPCLNPTRSESHIFTLILIFSHVAFHSLQITYVDNLSTDCMLAWRRGSGWAVASDPRLRSRVRSHPTAANQTILRSLYLIRRSFLGSFLNQNFF